MPFQYFSSHGPSSSDGYIERLVLPLSTQSWGGRGFVNLPDPFVSSFIIPKTALAVYTRRSFQVLVLYPTKPVIKFKKPYSSR